MRRIAFFMVCIQWLLAPGLICAWDGTISDSLALFKGRSLASTIRSAIPELPDWDRIRKIKVTPSAKFGYQRMGMSLRTPIPFELSIPGTESFKGESVDLRLPDVDVWVGEAKVEGKLTPAVELFASGAGNLLQNIVTSMSGRSGEDARTSVLWKHPFVWTEIEGGVVYRPWYHVAIVTGMRWDRFDLTIKEPEPLASVSVGPLRNLSLLPSDVLTELWIPYVGCEVRGDGFKLTLVGSPLASARMKARTRLKANVIPSYDFVGDVLITVKSPAYFLEARLDYKIEIASMTRASLWGKGGWLWASGGGRLDSSFNTTHSGLLVSILDDRVVRFGRYHLAGGLAVDLSF